MTFDFFFSQYRLLVYLLCGDRGNLSSEIAHRTKGLINKSIKYGRKLFFICRTTAWHNATQHAAVCCLHTIDFRCICLYNREIPGGGGKTNFLKYLKELMKNYTRSIVFYNLYLDAFY